MHQQAEDALRENNVPQALNVLDQLLLIDPQNDRALQLRARCYLSLEQPEDALSDYQSLDAIGSLKKEIAAEVELVLGRKNAFDLYKKVLASGTPDNETLFLAAVAAYRHGKISACYSLLHQTTNFQWVDDSPVDYLVQMVLPGKVFFYFEQKYIDVYEEKLEKK